MAVTVVILQEGTQGELRLTLDAPRVVIGRGKSCDIQLPDARVSARHASIRQQGGKNLIVDEGSGNGVCVKSSVTGATTRLPPRTPHTLADGDLVRVGPTWFEVRFAAGVPSTAADARALSRELLRASLRAAGEPCSARLGDLELADGAREYVFGRAADADLTLVEEQASRRHCAVARVGDVWQLRDLGSKSGTRVDGAPATGSVKLSDGARVGIGATELRFHDPLEQALAELKSAADVKMRPEELAAAPPGATPEPPPEAAPEAATEPDDDDEEEDAPRGALERLAEEPPPGGFGAVDAFVVLIALGVMGLSALGLAYVLG